MDINVPFQGYDYYSIGSAEEGIIFDESKNLVSIFGYEVGSYVKLRPDLMEVFKAHKFSKDFKELYSEGIFQVNEIQGHILHRSLRPDVFRLSLVMEEPAHREEFLFFGREFAPKFGIRINPGINSNPPFIIMCSSFLVKKFKGEPYIPINPPF